MPAAEPHSKTRFPSGAAMAHGVQVSEEMLAQLDSGLVEERVCKDCL